MFREEVKVKSHCRNPDMMKIVPNSQLSAANEAQQPNTEAQTFHMWLQIRSRRNRD